MTSSNEATLTIDETSIGFKEATEFKGITSSVSMSNGHNPLTSTRKTERFAPHPPTYTPIYALENTIELCYSEVLPSISK